ncbi:MAG: nitroreductase family protein [Sphaerochaeta sp.]|uniref:nitroreductase family protein n=1 Tax=Sphaerochaeta sp. TaxID=1972642 RepID=UPI002FCBDB49
MYETLHLLNQRRSIRSFEQRPIEAEQLRLLKEATLRAPSAGNMILYSIIEVHDPAKKEQLAEICDNQMMITKAPLVWVFLADMQKWVNYFKESGAVDHAMQQKDIPFRKPGLGDLHLCMQDAIVAAQNAVVAAQALGLGSCYIGDVIERFEDLRQLLDLKQYTIPACMLIFGYPKGKQQATKLTPRCPASSVFMLDTYAEPHLPDMERAYQEHEQDRRRMQGLPYDNTGTLADYYYLRKHTSTFMQEMNRSVQVMFESWCDG